jgi:serine protease Do
MNRNDLLFNLGSARASRAFAPQSAREGARAWRAEKATVSAGCSVRSVVWNQRLVARPMQNHVHVYVSTGRMPVGPTGKMPVLLANTLNMKTKAIILIVVSLIPLTAFSQPQPPNPPTPPTPPNPPMGPQPPRDREDRRPKVPVTFLGVDTSEVPSVLCDQLGLPKGFGLVVDYVVPDGPAAGAGVQQNDVLKMLNDQILTDPGQLSKLIRSYSEGTNVTLTVLRKGQEQKITVKLAKKEVPRRRANMRHMNHDWNFDLGDVGNMDDLKEQMSELKERLGDENRGMIHDAVVRAREEAQRATDEARRSIRTITRDNGALQRTTIDLNKAQIVLSDDKGELRIENKDGKKFLTAKDPQGKLLFSGPVETNEELDKAPAEVRQRYEKLQQHDLRAVAPDELRAESDNDEDDDDMDEESPSASNVSYDQVCSQGVGRNAWEIHTVLL